MQPTSSIYPSEPPVDRIRFNNNSNTNNNNNNNNNYQQSYQIPPPQQQQPPYHSLQHSLSTPVTAYSSRPPVYNSNSISNSNTGMRDESSFYTNMSSANNNNNYNSHQYNNNNNNNVPQWQPHMNAQYNHSQSQSLPPQYNQTTNRSNRAMSIPTPYHSQHNNHNSQHQFNHGGNIGHISPTDSASSSSVPLSPPQSAPVKSRAPRFIDTFQARILKQEMNVNSDGEATTTVKAKRKRRTPVLDPTTKLVRSQKHNEAEVRRRQRLNNLLLELAELVQCKKPQKSAILRITIEKCRQWQTKIQQLEEKLEKYEAKDNNQFSNNSTATAMTDNNSHSGSIDNNSVSASINVNTQSHLPSQSLSSMSISLADSSSTANSFINSSSSLTSNTFDSLSGISNSSPIPIIQSSTTLFPSNHNAFSNNDSNHVNDGQNLPLSFTVKEEPNSLTDSINLSMRNYSMSSHNNNENIINSGAIGNISSNNNSSNIIVISDHDNILPSLPPLLDTTTSSSLLTNTISSSPLITSNYSSSSSSFHRVIDLMHDATVAMDLVDLNGRILDCNQLFADFTGYTKSELFDPHATFFNLTHPDSLNASFSLLSSLITANHSVGRTMKKYVHKSGKTITALLTAFMVNDHQGQANCVCTIFEPVEADLQGM